VEKVGKELSADVTTYTDYGVLLASGELDAVVIAAPQFLHAEMAVGALNAGVHVFCEKPMAMTVLQCRQMIDAAQRNGKCLMIGQVLRYISVFRYVLEKACSGELGRPVAMRTIRNSGHWGKPWLTPWRLKRATCGGMLPEVNVHEIDLMLNIMGPATSVTALGGNYTYPEVDYEDFVNVQITFAGGGIGCVTSGCCDYVGQNSGEVYLERGTIVYNSLAGQVHIGRDGHESEVLAYQDIYPDAENAVAREMREFIEACLGEHPVTIPGEDGMRAVEICEAAYLSIQEGRTVDLPLP
jgi:predicted dehydrogenase